MFNRKSSHGLTLGVLTLLFIAAVLLANVLFRGWRLDLTPNQQYTLSAGTKQILAGLDEPINLYFFLSEQSSERLPQYRAYAQRVHELLDEMVSRSNGKLRLTRIDPQPFSEEEDQATSFGIPAVPIPNSQERLIFGLAATNSTTEKAFLPFFDPAKETFLEYDLARLIESLNKPEKVVVGVISSLPMTGGFDPNTRQMSEGWAIHSQIGELYQMQPLGAQVTQIDANVKVVMLVHPKNLEEDTLYALDQFVLRGGRLLVFVDPQAAMDRAEPDPTNPTADMFAAKTSDLPRLFEAWKVKFDPSKVVMDRRLGVEIQPDRSRPPFMSPIILRFGKAQMNQSDIVSGELEGVIADTVGHFTLAEGAADAGFTLVPLLSSSLEATLVDADSVRFMPDPSSLLADYTPAGEAYVVAGRLQGKFKTAFPDRSGEGHLAEAAQAGEVVLFGDVDLLGDPYWVQVQNFFGQKIYNTFANNGELVLNTVENLAGSNALISIRARGSSVRPFEYVDELRRQAGEKYVGVEKKLNEELAQTEQKLTDLQQGKSADQAMILSAQQRAELERFQTRKLEIRKELRQVQAELNQDVKSLGVRVKLINILLVPILVAVLGLIYFARRAARRSRTAAVA